jgi:hypothetical protein
LKTAGHINHHTYLPELETTLQKMIDHARLQGIDEGLKVADKLLIWLTADPPQSHEYLAQCLRAEIEAAEKKAQRLLGEPPDGTK